MPSIIETRSYFAAAKDAFQSTAIPWTEFKNEQPQHVYWKKAANKHTLAANAAIDVGLNDLALIHLEEATIFIEYSSSTGKEYYEAQRADQRPG